MLHTLIVFRFTLIRLVGPLIPASLQKPLIDHVTPQFVFVIKDT